MIDKRHWSDKPLLHQAYGDDAMQRIFNYTHVKW